MDPVRLGAAIRAAREDAGLSVRGLAAQIGVHHSYVARLEGADYRNIRPALLTRLSRVLEIDERDLYAIAGMDAPEGLPTFSPYLRAKYDIPDQAIEEMKHYFDYVSSKYQVQSKDIPRPGAGNELDELDDPEARSRPDDRPTSRNKPSEQSAPHRPSRSQGAVDQAA